MKQLNHTLLFMITLVMGVVFWPLRMACAQQGDTLTIEWQDPQTQLVIYNALRNQIAADTLADGTRAHKVYKLMKGGFYWITDPIQNDNFPLTIVGEKADPNDPRGNPPVIQIVTREDGTNPSDRMITGVDNITLKNVWIVGAMDNGVQTNYQPVTITGNNKRYVFDHVIFERSNFAIPAFTGTNNNIYFTNCTFRNLIGMPSTQQWEGRGISIWASQDTVIVENNTFFNVEFTAFQLEGGYAKYFRFNHNTVVNQGRQINALNKKKVFFTNNLFLNGFWQGEGRADLTTPGRDPNQYSTGLFPVQILPAQYGLESERLIVVANIAAWRDSKFATFYGDSVHAQPIVGDSAAYFFKTNDHIIARDTMWLTSPPAGMTTTDAFTGAIVDSMWNNITDLRRGITPAQSYFYKLPTQATAVSWPLPENFAYTDATLMQAGTDKLPLGDLNWFPDKLQQFEANKATYIEEIEGLGGKPPTYDIKAIIEAESGQLGGDAKVDTIQGTTFYTMRSGGFIKWTFELNNAATYGLKIKTRSNDATRGEYIYINGNASITKGDDGGYLFKGLTMPAWQWYTITKDTLTTETAAFLDFKQGTNTIEIKPEWGYQDFSEVDLFAGGDPNNVVVQLTAPMAVTELVEPGVEDASGQAVSNVPSGFMNVELGSGGGTGSITFNVDSLADGSYLARIYYMSPDGAQTGQILVNDVVADPSVNFAESASMTNITTKLFTIKSGQVVTQAGTQSTLKLSANGHVYIDYFQLAQQTTAIEPGSGQLPSAYVLDQNYPNPFNPTTTIRFKLPQASNVQLTVYNVLGQKVAVLVNNRLSAGTHIVQFNARALASGLYFYQLRAGNFVMNKKMMLIK